MVINEPVEALPHFTDEELEQLDLAVGVRIQHMRSIVATAQAPKILDDAEKALRINLSLSTSISEARMALAARREYIEKVLEDLTKAEPGEDGRCMHCKLPIKSVPGGNGPMFVHEHSQVVICDQRCPHCGHAPHIGVCLNMASDNDCSCTGVKV